MFKILMLKFSYELYLSFALAAACSAAIVTSASAQTPLVTNDVPVLYCSLNQMTSCEKNKACKEQKEFEGIKLPLKMTFDIPSSAVAYTEADGWVYTGKIVSAAENSDMIMLYGTGRVVSWQMQVHKKSAEGSTKQMSIQIGTADAASTGFGECELAK